MDYGSFRVCRDDRRNLRNAGRSPVDRRSRDPDQHQSRISFAIWSNLVHGGLMAIQAFANPVHMAHLGGDVLALLLIGVVLAYLAPASLWMRLGREAV